MRAFALIILFTSYLNGQETLLKKIKPDDYHLWGNLDIRGVSQDGKWVNYGMHYENTDTIFVQNLENNNRLEFNNIPYLNFYYSKWYAGLSRDSLIVIDLKKGTKFKIPDVKSFDFSNEGKYLTFLSEGTLFVKNIMDNNELYRLYSVTEFKFNEDKDKLAFVQELTTRNNLGALEIKNNGQIMESTLATLPALIHGVSWAPLGNAFTAYFEGKDKKRGLLFYNYEQKNLYQFDKDSISTFPLNYSINPQGQYKLKVSNDLTKVFFPINENNIHESEKNIDVEIWNAQKQLTYIQEGLWKNAFSNKLGVWFPEDDKFLIVTSDELPNSFLSGDENYAVVFNPNQYEPQYEYVGAKDFYAINFKTNEVDLFLEKHNGYLPHISPSPMGKYIGYFKNENWWVYHLENKEHKNLTKFLKVRLKNGINESNGEIQAYGIAGWSDNDSFIFIYDKYDIWKIDTENSKSERITDGRERGVIFRFANPKNSNTFIANFDGWKGRVIDQDEGFLIQAQGLDASSGYYFWSLESGLEKIAYKQSKIDAIFMANDSIVYREQCYDKPPKIVQLSKKKNEKILFESNSHQKDYYWGKAESITYKIPNGRELKGILYYPGDFNPLKKYPMVVQIYEKHFQNFHSYISPADYSSIGFNITNFVLDGYFVFLPDIEYEINAVGMSAFRCVVSAVNKVKEKKYISENKIGLIGHSFGGYETNFIITQTDLFAAAVSSAGVADLVSFYLNLNWNTGKPDIWRFKNQIWRMDKSLFEDRGAFYENSPISFVENINTPLLSWTGDKDYQVNWHQSILWYLALRKLNKKHILLVYPNESHILLNLMNKKDVSMKVKQWFDFYLKDKSPASWIDE